MKVIETCQTLVTKINEIENTCSSEPDIAPEEDNNAQKKTADSNALKAMENNVVESTPSSLPDSFSSSLKSNEENSTDSEKHSNNLNGVEEEEEEQENETETVKEKEELKNCNGDSNESQVLQDKDSKLIKSIDEFLNEDKSDDNIKLLNKIESDIKITDKFIDIKDDILEKENEDHFPTKSDEIKENGISDSKEFEIEKDENVDMDVDEKSEKVDSSNEPKSPSLICKINRSSLESLELFKNKEEITNNNDSSLEKNEKEDEDILKNNKIEEESKDESDSSLKKETEEINKIKTIQENKEITKLHSLENDLELMDTNNDDFQTPQSAKETERKNLKEKEKEVENEKHSKSKKEEIDKIKTETTKHHSSSSKSEHSSSSKPEHSSSSKSEHSSSSKSEHSSSFKSEHSSSSKPEHSSSSKSEHSSSSKPEHSSSSKSEHSSSSKPEHSSSSKSEHSSSSKSEHSSSSKSEHSSSKSEHSGSSKSEHSSSSKSEHSVSKKSDHHDHHNSDKKSSSGTKRLSGTSLDEALEPAKKIKLSNTVEKDNKKKQDSTEEKDSKKNTEKDVKKKHESSEKKQKRQDLTENSEKEGKKRHESLEKKHDSTETKKTSTEEKDQKKIKISSSEKDGKKKSNREEEDREGKKTKHKISDSKSDREKDAKKIKLSENKDEKEIRVSKSSKEEKENKKSTKPEEKEVNVSKKTNSETETKEKIKDKNFQEEKVKSENNNKLKQTEVKGTNEKKDLEDNKKSEELVKIIKIPEEDEEVLEIETKEVKIQNIQPVIILNDNKTIEKKILNEYIPILPKLVKKDEELELKTEDKLTVRSKEQTPLPGIRRFITKEKPILTKKDLNDIIVQQFCNLIHSKCELGQTRTKCHSLEQSNKKLKNQLENINKQIQHLSVVIKRGESKGKEKPMPLKLVRSVAIQVGRPRPILGANSQSTTNSNINKLKQNAQNITPTQGTAISSQANTTTTTKNILTTPNSTRVFQNVSKSNGEDISISRSTLSEPPPLVMQTKGVKTLAPRTVITRPPPLESPSIRTLLPVQKQTPPPPLLTTPPKTILAPTLKNPPVLTPANTLQNRRNNLTTQTTTATRLTEPPKLTPLTTATTTTTTKINNNNVIDIDLTDEDEVCALPPKQTTTTTTTSAPIATTNRAVTARKITTLTNPAGLASTVMRAGAPQAVTWNDLLTSKVGEIRLISNNGGIRCIPTAGQLLPSQPVSTYLLTSTPTLPANVLMTNSTGESAYILKNGKFVPAQLTPGFVHPAPLPVQPPVASTPGWLAPPPRPDLQISRVNAKPANGIVLSWMMNLTRDFAEIVSYQLFAYEETQGAKPSTSLWKKVGDVKALPLPMACTLTQFVVGHKYHFAVRAVDIHARIGPFSQPGSIVLASVGK